MIRSTMQDFPLTIGAIMRHGARVYGGSECVTWTGAGARRTTYAQVARNAGRLAGALAQLGIGAGANRRLTDDRWGWSARGQSSWSRSVELVAVGPFEQGVQVVGGVIDAPVQVA